MRDALQALAGERLSIAESAPAGRPSRPRRQKPHSFHHDQISLEENMLLPFIRRVFCAAFVAVLASPVGPAAAQDRRQDEPGQFDFYVLVLSWSPSFCASSEERNPDRASHNPQCGGRPFAFVVHGLWPQYEKGFPEFCQVPAPRLNRTIVSGMLDLMPAPQLIFHEWDRHGVCSGLSANGYFETIRKARAVVKIPPRYIDVQSTLTVSPEEVENAFLEANPAMKPDGISVTCSAKWLSDVRICMTRDLQFRSCEQLEHRSCRRNHLVMPPVRGG
jgi:ribonuclease T2